MGVAISIENAVKRFGKDTIINGLSLDIKPLTALRAAKSR